MTRRLKPTVLVLSQVFPPDPAAVGQYMADASRRLAARGSGVRVLTANRGYEDPSQRFPTREEIDGVEVRRLPLSSSGKATLFGRLLGQIAFVVQSTMRGLFTRNLSAVLCTTSPPFAAAAGLAIGRLRGVPVHYWLMDINPDQALVTGQLRQTSVLAKALDWLNRQTLRRATTVISLDRFMEERIHSKRDDVRASMEIVPPWPLDSHIEPPEAADNAFVRRNGLAGKRIVMYSGNHSPVHPLNTLLAAAHELEHREDLLFVFVGGGLEKARVEEAISDGARNLVSLPYQPLSEISASLAAADVHVVVLGDEMRGIVHPSKVYNAMLVGRPVLYFGPQPSHVTDLLDQADIGWAVDHGEVERAVAVLSEIADADAQRLRDMGQEARAVVLKQFDPTTVSDRLCNLISAG